MRKQKEKDVTNTIIADAQRHKEQALFEKRVSKKADEEAMVNNAKSLETE